MPRRGLAALGPISPASPAASLPSEISARRGCSLLPAGSVPWVAGRGACSAGRCEERARPRVRSRGEACAARIKGASAKSGRQASFISRTIPFPYENNCALLLRLSSPLPSRHFGCGRRHPSVAARAAAFASAPSTRGAPRGPRHSLFEPGLSAGRRSRRQHVGPPGVPRNCPGRGDRWRPKSPDVVEPKQTRSSRARRHAHLPPGGLVAAK